MSHINLIAEQRSFDGRQLRYEMPSETLSSTTRFSLYLPPIAEQKPVPAVLWLSGLTCTDENFVTKAGAQSQASRLGIALIAPDTSPRGEGIADDPEGAYDLGQGAGFYVDATQTPWREHYQMYSFVIEELIPTVLTQHPIEATRLGVSGHSMGGHGALTIGLKHPEKFKSISAFAPIGAPTQCAWGQKAFSAYLGEDPTQWQSYDSCELLQSLDTTQPILIDQGDADEFLADQLGYDKLVEASKKHSNINIRLREGYDHSYFFIASFIAEHLSFHHSVLDG